MKEMTVKEAYDYKNVCPYYCWNLEIANHYKIEACLFRERPLYYADECKIDKNGTCAILGKVTIKGRFD